MIELLSRAEAAVRRVRALQPARPPAGQPLTPGQLAMLHAATLLPADEPQRLAELRDVSLLDTEADEEYDSLVQLAAAVCGTPMAALTFVDATRQWYRARVGIPVADAPREAGFCARAILVEDTLLEVPDAAAASWFDPFLHGPASRPVRFYAGVPLRTREGSAIGTLCVMDEVARHLTVSQRQALERLGRALCSQLGLRRQLRRATQTDRLTGLPNWLHFESQFESAHPREGVVCFVRLKALSQISTAHGFRVADALVQQAATRLRALAEEGAFVGRIKRGLFLLFFPDMAPAAFTSLQAPRLAAQLQAPYTVNELTLVCPLHLGFAAYPRDGATLDEVVNAADNALQLAIERDEPAAFFDRHVDTAASTHYRLEPQLRAALARDEFVNYYQPKVEVASGRIVGVEALIRWIHPQRGLVPPAEFVPALEATGLIREVGRHVLQRAAADWQRWHDAGLPAPRIAINVAAAQLRDGEFIGDLQAALARVGGQAAALGIEVTESVLIRNMERATAVLSQVRAMGLPVAIDDFGTGYSSLAYIVTLPVDEVKIDRSFVARIATDAAYRGLVGTCVGLARNLSLRVVAEGVENEAQARELLALKCDQAQGYLYSPPVPAGDIVGMLAHRALPA
ncbi:sensor domain-containing phosphodiesterase [Ramlibacter tataouinensis]|uniref:putative bifunctional diguanylate cyclase/phosphodiesterase n=1 Tax=Ramlibacter tataouinensis TaxID=94132 RepID=UPI0022F39916|nr:sensor domain-containing phosphodiesterase [Ramlibacter tataouinensis]WBY00634.1 sensor domain-containing phosphodiesterase [Ramlibacter tataouinensis]